MSSPLPPWDQLAFTFGTDPDPPGPVQQCSNLTFNYYKELPDNAVPNPPPDAPYNIVIYAGGMQPLMVPMHNNNTSGGQFKWIVNLPTGKYGVSMKESKGYSGGIMTPMLQVTTGKGCNTNSVLKTSTLDVAVSGNSQCGQAIVVVKNGTAPYTVEVVPANNGQQKTIHFSSSPFSLVLDISAGVEYFLAVSDSAGHSSVEGLYKVGSSSDNGCLGAASTVSAGQLSTLYPGGTASTPTATVTPISSPQELASSAVIAMAVAIPVAVIILALLTLWFCYKRNRRQNAQSSGEKPDIDPYDPITHNTHTGYTPVPTSYHLGSIAGTGSYHDLSSGSGSQHPLPPTPYRFDSMAADRQTLNTTESTASASGVAPSGTSMSEKRRNLLNPDSNNLGPVASEPFDPYAGGSGPPSHPVTQPRMPPLPPAYSHPLGS